jgi:hypothetical protein
LKFDRHVAEGYLALPIFKRGRFSYARSKKEPGGGTSGSLLWLKDSVVVRIGCGFRRSRPCIPI